MRLETANAARNKKREELLAELKKVNNETVATKTLAKTELEELEEKLTRAKLTRSRISSIFADLKRAEKVDIHDGRNGQHVLLY